MERRPDIERVAERRGLRHVAIERRLQVIESTIYKVDDSARPTEAAPALEKVDKGFTPPFRPAGPRPVKRRGPIIAGGIIRFDLGANEEQ
jgi:hypothetical protein